MKQQLLGHLLFPSSVSDALQETLLLQQSFNRADALFPTKFLQEEHKHYSCRLETSRDATDSTERAQEEEAPFFLHPPAKILSRDQQLAQL